MNLTIRTKMLFLGSIVFIAILAILLNFYINNANGLKYVEQVTEDIVEEQINEKIKLLTLSMAEGLGGLLEGVKDEKEQIAIIAKVIEKFRFENDQSGYFFVYKKTVNVAHPVRKDLIGTDLKDFKDAKGVHYVVELYKQAKNGGGFVFYDFTKGGSNSTVAQKNAYAALIPHTDDIWISTGVYVDTLAENVEKDTKGVREYFSSSFFQALVISIVLLILICPFAFLFYKRLNVSIGTISRDLFHFFDFINYKTNEIKLSKIAGNDELAQMAAAINQNIQATKEGLDQDKQAVKESVTTVGIVENGDLTARITANPRNPQLIELKS
ncbi:cache domain-containing protein, partial [Campylobacter vulpis]